MDGQGLLETTVCITEEGDLVCVYDPALRPVLAQLGIVHVSRASYIEPVCRPLRWAFHWIRRRVGDDGWIAATTRLWPCLWQADLSPVDGPVLGPYRRRCDAVQAEHRWLTEHLDHLEKEAGSCF